MIRRNNDVFNGPISYLLNVPEVRDLASTTLHEGRNELAHLAVRRINKSALRLLIQANIVQAHEWHIPPPVPAIMAFFRDPNRDQRECQWTKIRLEKQ